MTIVTVVTIVAIVATRAVMLHPTLLTAMIYSEGSELSQGGAMHGGIFASLFEQIAGFGPKPCTIAVCVSEQARVRARLACRVLHAVRCVLSICVPHVLRFAALKAKGISAAHVDAVRARVKEMQAPSPRPPVAALSYAFARTCCHPPITPSGSSAFMLKGKALLRQCTIDTATPRRPR